MWYMRQASPRICPFSWILGATLFLATLGTVPGAAQVEGTVVDRAQRPVTGALIELWLDSRRTAAARTDDEGRFEVAREDGGEMVMLTARRVGLATQTVQIHARDTTLLLTMDVQAVSLQALTVEASASRRCPMQDDPRARALWTSMRSRYWQPDDDTVLIYAFMERRVGRGEKSDAYDPEAGAASAGWTTGALVLAHPDLMSRSGYATRGGGGAGERTAYWTYRVLDQASAQDFSTDFFGSAHTLSLVSQSPDRMVIAFCPRERLRRTGQIQGTLVLRPDTTLSSARWRFHTPEPREDAGGEASYVPPDPEYGRALLTQETFFWRRSGSAGLYYFEARAFSGWRRWYRAAARPPVAP